MGWDLGFHGLAHLEILREWLGLWRCVGVRVEIGVLESETELDKELVGRFVLSRGVK